MPEDQVRKRERMRLYMAKRRASDPAYQRSARVERACACGAVVMVRPDSTGTRCGSCSRRAAALAGAERRRARRLPVVHPAPVRPSWVGRPPTVLRPSRRVWFAGYCRSCAAPFIHDQPQTVTCSAACSKRLGRARYRAQKRNAFVAPVCRAEIFARDLWRCLLCGDPLAMAAVVPHPLAPTIDHVIPLARGGWHAPDNVQAAHFLCNSRKADRSEVA